MITVIFSMTIFALVGAISPGPVNIIATSSGASFGFRRTVPHVLGATLAYTLIVLLVGIGLNQWLSLYPQITAVMTYLGSVFLLYMAFKIATAVPIDFIQGADIEQPPAFIEGALAQVLNPKAWLVSMSGVSVFVSVHNQSMLYLLVFCIISFIVCFIGIATWAALGQLIQGLLSSRSRQIKFNISMGLLLTCTVVSMLLGS